MAVNKPLTVLAHLRKQDPQNTPRERILLVKSKTIFTIRALHITRVEITRRPASFRTLHLDFN